MLNRCRRCHGRKSATAAELCRSAAEGFRVVRRALGAIGLVGAVAWLTVGNWASGPTCANTPAEMFEGTIAQPVPGGVSDIQGAGDMWQSYAVWLRFRATDAAVAELLRDGFTRVSLAEAGARFRLPDGYDRFRPRWTPPAERVECYRAGRRCPWSTAGGHQWLLVDRGAGVVYAYAEGD